MAAPDDPKQMLDRWQREMADMIMRNVSLYRIKRGLTNDQLRERLGRLGWEISRDGLATVLSGGKKRKNVPISEVLLLAQALNVAPAALLFPVDTNQTVALAPIAGAESSAVDAVRWFVGRQEGGVQLGNDVVDDFYEVSDVVGLFEELDQNLQNFASANADLIVGSYRDEDMRVLIVDAAVRIVQEIIEIRRSVKNVYPSARLPEVRPALAFVDERRPTIPPLPLVGYNTSDELAEAERRRDASPA